eukprot:CAMPEP_0202729792 /NCGR_PEP_ID=MMETSP1385-20130828/186314_1 /ASSEMBLY_ACC=CAM_ASM_000861 /TAXON_ID=933848 /ORGANISM="Elphidium margaritaceum" /LENGTH=737 /DNA_ID=CAMNT_0049396063 /DNA_START=24 /DNA_END=2237 /DNA_ORIENTATION=-
MSSLLSKLTSQTQDERRHDYGSINGGHTNGLNVEVMAPKSVELQSSPMHTHNDHHNQSKQSADINDQLDDKLNHNQDKQNCCTSDNCMVHCAAISGILPEYGNTIGDCLIVPYLLELDAPIWATSYVWLFTPIIDFWVQMLCGRLSDSYVWLFTPIIDFWVQMLCGRLSDKYTQIPDACCKCGGRKPFILFFGFLASIGLIIIPQARLIKQAGHVALAVIVCIASYTIMDMAHGDLLIPTRSLVNDLCHSSRMMRDGNTRFSAYQQIGRFLGYGVVSLPWKSFFREHAPFVHRLFNELALNHQISICFTLSIFILWAIILFVVCSTPSQIERLQSSSAVVSKNSDCSVQYIPFHKRAKKQQHKVISNEMFVTPSGRVVVLHATQPATQTLHDVRCILGTPSKGMSDFLESLDEFESTSSSPLALTAVSNANDDGNSDVHAERVSPIADRNKGIVIDAISSAAADTTASSSSGISATVVVHDNNTNGTLTTARDHASHEHAHDHSWQFPQHFKLLWIIQFLGWSNFASFSLYFTSFIASDVYGGNPQTVESATTTTSTFEVGLMMSSRILILNTFFALLSATFIVPVLNKRFGVKCTFFVGELCLNILLASLLFARHSSAFVITIVCLYGVALYIHYNNLFIIVETDMRQLFRSEKRRGRILSIFNVTMLFANVYVSMTAGWIVYFFDNQFVYGISFFAIVALVGDLIVLLIFFSTQKEHMFDGAQRYDVSTMVHHHH